MSLAVYYAVWLLVGLLLVAAVSAAVVRQQRRHAQCQAQAQALLEALSRYAVCVAAQRRGEAVLPARNAADSALRAARRAQARWFPALGPAFESLLESHRRLHAFLREQQDLRAQAPETWLDSQPAPTLDDLWRRHAQALDALTRQLGATRSARSL